jgi:hypothetical protein
LRLGHRSLALKAIIGRTRGNPRYICASQAEVENNFDIITNYIKEAADKYGKRESDLTGTDLSYSLWTARQQFLLLSSPRPWIPRKCRFSILAYNCPDLQHLLPDGWVAQADPDSGTTYYCHRTTRTTRWDMPQPNDQPNPEAPEHDNLEPPSVGKERDGTTEQTSAQIQEDAQKALKLAHAGPPSSSPSCRRDQHVFLAPILIGPEHDRVHQIGGMD